jgi:hypothetical protein
MILGTTDTQVGADMSRTARALAVMAMLTIACGIATRVEAQDWTRGSTLQCNEFAWVVSGAAAARDVGYPQESVTHRMIALLADGPAEGVSVEEVVMDMFDGDDRTPGDWFAASFRRCLNHSRAVEREARADKRKARGYACGCGRVPGILTFCQ